jgi:hypothetical protein
VISPAGTCCYRFALRGSEAPWRSVALLDGPVELTGDYLSDARLVGHSPALDIWGDRITLIARQRDLAGLAAVFLAIDPDIPARFCAGDMLHLARTGTGGLGASVFRDGRLVLGVGAVRSVPLGEDVQAEVVWPESARAMTGPFHLRSESAVAFTVGGQRHLMPTGHASRLGTYTIWVDHGLTPGLPGTEECVSISVEDRFPADAALRWARLLDDQRSLTMVGWDEAPE